MTNESLLAALERSGLIEDGVLAQLRRQVAQSQGLDAAAIVRRLVGDGHLTKTQGDRLLAAPAAPADPKAQSATVDVEPDDDLEVLDEDEQPLQKVSAPTGHTEDLEVLPDDEEDLLPPPPPSRAPSKPVRKPSASQAETRGVDEDLGLAPIENDPLLSPLRPPSAERKATSPAPRAAIPPPPKPAAKKKRRTWRNEVAPAAPELANQVDDLLDAAAAAEKSGPLSKEARQAARLAQRAPRNAWDSPLLLIGGGSLVGMLLLGAVLLYVMRRQTGDQALELAEQDYKAGAFAQSIAKFDQYLENFPKHGSVSAARVHRGLAEMRSANEVQDWTKALATAKTATDQISRETEFPSAQGDLASILPAIAGGLAKRAHDKPATTLVEQAREATALVDKYVPITMQPSEEMREVAASLALTERVLGRDRALDAAVAKMQEALKAGTPAATYAARRELLQTYPELADNERLTAEMVAAAEADRAAVKFTDEKRAPETTEGTSATLASLALTATTGPPAPIEDVDTVMILDAGAIYALEARSGKPRWRRFVGFDTDYVPQVIKTPSDAVALVVDAVQQGLVLVDAATGKLRWRQKIEDWPPAAPTVVRDRVLVASRSGQLMVFDLASGQLRGHFHLPQSLRVAPVVEPRERLYYQVADNANLYVVSAETGDCREVFYLGHEPETIATPPLMVGRYLIVAINSGAEDSQLRVLLADEEGLKLKQVEQVALRGHVYSSPAVSGRALIVATDRGALYSFEFAAPDSGRVLTRLAEKPADDKPAIVPFLASRGAELWLAAYGLTRYDIQASRGALAPKWINDEQGVVLHAPLVAGPAIAYVTRNARSVGASAAAINGVDGRRFWETRLGVPLAAPPILSNESEKAVAVTAAGGLYEVPAAGLASRKLMDAPAAGAGERFNLEPNLPLVQLADGRCVFTQARVESPGGLRELLIYDPQSQPKLRRRALTEAAAAQPVAFGEGLLVPAKIGQVLVIDPDTGRRLIAPFQPVVDAGSEVAWTEPTTFADQALISDGATKLYRLAVVASPKPHLEAAATVALAVPLVTKAEVVGEFAYAVDTGHRVLSFRLPDLAPAADWPLDGRAVWGPTRVGDHVLVATMSGQLTCVDQAGAMNWQVALEAGSIVGQPIVLRGAIVAATHSGAIVRLAIDSGKVLSQINLGQPLALGPVVWHDRLLLTGSDGTLHIVAEPK